MSLKVSYIVPVYNVEKYVKACIDSILSQTIKDYEVIVINDGSTDSSLEILNREYGNDGRVHIISQKNQGQGVCRNLGVDIANGEYVQFVDSDDTLESNMTEQLLAEAEKNNADITICAYNNINTYQKKTYTRKLRANFSDLNGIGEIILLMEKEQLSKSPWNKLYRRDFIKDVKQLPISPGQDVEFNFRLYAKTPRLAYVDVPLYNFYSRGSSSITHSYRKQLAQSQKMVYAAKESFFNSLPEQRPEYAEFLERQKMFNYVFLLRNVYRFGSPYNFSGRTEYIKESLIDDKSARQFLNHAKPADKIEKIFVTLYKVGNPLMMNIVFTLLFIIQRKFVKRA